METTIGIHANPATPNEIRLVDRNDGAKAVTLEKRSIVEWYQILRAHHRWTIFQAIRFALWLTR